MTTQIISMHIDWAREMVERQEANKAPDIFILKLVADDRRILNLVKASFEDEKTVSIAQTILNMNGERYKKPTEKQRAFLANRLIEKFATARAAIAAAFGISEQEMFN